MEIRTGPLIKTIPLKNIDSSIVTSPDPLTNAHEKILLIKVLSALDMIIGNN